MTSIEQRIFHRLTHLHIWQPIKNTLHERGVVSNVIIRNMTAEYAGWIKLIALKLLNYLG